jgi:hypothetical protein
MPVEAGPARSNVRPGRPFREMSFASDKNYVLTPASPNHALLTVLARAARKEIRFSNAEYSLRRRFQCYAWATRSALLPSTCS